MSDTEVLLPVYHKKATNIMKFYKKSTFYTFRLPISGLGWIILGSTFLSFFFCVIWSIVYNFEEANATHCLVENYLPSISAAIGHYYPQIYVWNTSILIQIIPRLKISTIYHHYFLTIIYDEYSNMCYIAWLSNVLELCALLGLSLITSTTNYGIHAFCFVSFLLSSLMHMIVSCYLLKYRRKVPAGNMEIRILKWKFMCCLLNLLFFILAGYFFRRHNAYCEPKVYSIFAFFEYGVVITNILFHLPAVWDFHDRSLTVSLTSRGFEIDYNPPFKSTIYDIK